MLFRYILCFIGCVSQVFSDPIVGGTNAAFTKFTYQVSLEDDEGFHFCGGSIISSLWVLTAAHCIVNTNIIVVTGSVYQNAGVRHAVKSIIVHEYYNEITVENDVAVIELLYGIRFNKNTQPIKLSFRLPPSQTNLTTTGWGYQNESARISPNHLQMLAVKSITFSKCLQYEPIDPEEPLVKLIVGKNFCVQNPQGEGICNGDSGGGIVWNETLIGVISFGADKCAIGKPVVCSSIPAFRYWIEKTTGVQINEGI
ncbi:Chymotrypsin-like protease CTRL-1 [Pseudolycoriella hygida]|uniref:Chymotrypsin-like protease CTRL-1 n=1 Tax=Pseudolycoriella hygida TaxID=35572 RepID=A0A9Q0N0T1_9DIPT|nr:Chymotrypsin-like protease CTRL-1 [Pseudolycoriella hygida]